ncbi:hypothetical protein CWO91_13965 [Bradyrhizobium genosp. SA-3]|nr:hypothetical protein CWO91_13965 [Bradyrhizobium genosp. SA-3]
MPRPAFGFEVGNDLAQLPRLLSGEAVAKMSREIGVGHAAVPRDDDPGEEAEARELPHAVAQLLELLIPSRLRDRLAKRGRKLGDARFARSRAVPPLPVTRTTPFLLRSVLADQLGVIRPRRCSYAFFEIGCENLR